MPPRVLVDRRTDRLVSALPRGLACGKMAVCAVPSSTSPSVCNGLLVEKRVPCGFTNGLSRWLDWRRALLCRVGGRAVPVDIAVDFVTRPVSRVRRSMLPRKLHYVGIKLLHGIHLPILPRYGRPSAARCTFAGTAAKLQVTSCGLTSKRLKCLSRQVNGSSACVGSLPRGAMQGLLVSSVGDGIKEFAFKHTPRRVLLAVAAILLACASVVALHEVGAHTQLCVAGSCAHATPFPAVQLRAGACFTLLSPKWVLIIASFTAYTAYRRQIVEGESAPACALAGTVCH